MMQSDAQVKECNTYFITASHYEFLMQSTTLFCQTAVPLVQSTLSHSLAEQVLGYCTTAQHYSTTLQCNNANLHNTAKPYCTIALHCSTHTLTFTNTAICNDLPEFTHISFTESYILKPLCAHASLLQPKSTSAFEQPSQRRLLYLNYWQGYAHIRRAFFASQDVLP